MPTRISESEQNSGLVALSASPSLTLYKVSCARALFGVTDTSRGMAEKDTLLSTNPLPERDRPARTRLAATSEGCS